MTHARFFIEELLPTNWWGHASWHTVALSRDLAMLRDIAFAHDAEEK